MNFRQFFKYALWTFAGIAFISGCKKVQTPDPLGNQGQTIVKFIDGLADTASGYSSGYKTINIDLVSTPQTFEMVEVRRDVANNAELNKPMTIIIADDPGAVSTYDSQITPLPSGSYSADAATPLTGDKYTVTFLPGEFSKVIKITINNILAVDLSKNYGLGFTIAQTEPASAKIASLEKSIVVRLGFKNKYDGVYLLKGYILRNIPPIDEASTGWVGPREISLATTGANSVRYTESHGWANTATTGLAVSVSNPTLTVDPLSNAVTITSEGGAFPNGLKEVEGQNSRYNPATKTFYTYATWSGGITSRLMSDTLVYLRPR